MLHDDTAAQQEEEDDNVGAAMLSLYERMYLQNKGVLEDSLADIVQSCTNNLFLCDSPCNVLKKCKKHRCTIKCCDRYSKIATKAQLQQSHPCDIVCGKNLQCGNHQCEEPCHPGPCPPCRQSVWEELSCRCGMTVLPPPHACGTGAPACDHPCSVPRVCGHPVHHPCHNDGPCPPCMVRVDKQCGCGSTTVKAVLCGSTNVSCGRACPHPSPCGAHMCPKRCHSGSCDAAQAFSLPVGSKLLIGARSDSSRQEQLQSEVQECYALMWGNDSYNYEEKSDNHDVDEDEKLPNGPPTDNGSADLSNKDSGEQRNLETMSEPDSEYEGLCSPRSCSEGSDWEVVDESEPIGSSAAAPPSPHLDASPAAVRTKDFDQEPPQDESWEEDIDEPTGPAMFCRCKCSSVKRCGHLCELPCHGLSECPATCGISVETRCRCGRLRQTMKCTGDAPVGPLDCDSLCEEEGLRAKRNQALAEALGIDGSDSFFDRSRQLFSFELVLCATEHSLFVQRVEKVFAEVVQRAPARGKWAPSVGGDKVGASASLWPMPTEQRWLVHSLATCYGLASESFDSVSGRTPMVWATNSAAIPAKLLSSVASPRLIQNCDCIDDLVAKFDKSLLVLTDINSTGTGKQAELRVLLPYFRTWGDDSRLRWIKPGLAVALFDSEDNLRAANEQIGGGVRGVFRSRLFSLPIYRHGRVDSDSESFVPRPKPQPRGAPVLPAVAQVEVRNSWAALEGQT